MNLFLSFLLAATLGVVSSVPIAGPVAAMVVRSAVQGRFAYARALAAGGGMAEAVYATVALVAFDRVQGVLKHMAGIMSLLPVVLLLGVGYALSRFKLRGNLGATQDDKDEGSGPGPEGQREGFLMGATLAGVNVALLGSWSGLIAAVHSLNVLSASPAGAVVFYLGVASGITAWFALLTYALQRFQHKLRPSMLAAGVRYFGSALMGLGVLLGVQEVAKRVAGLDLLDMLWQPIRSAASSLPPSRDAGPMAVPGMD